jgi:hydrogenase nickel incorporation protein HypB
MCSSCGCGTDSRTVSVVENLLSENDHVAAHVREHLNAHGVLAINLMSSPGAGKTSLLEATFGALPPGIRIAVVEGDLETENDANRIRRHGVKAVQITTGVTCHLDAAMIHDALHEISLADVDILFIENVGNLVCPADFDVGEHLDVVLLSVTEGDDKPDKYPIIFRGADMVLLTKTDLLPFIEEFDVGRARTSVGRVRAGGTIAELSAKTGRGLEAWTTWLCAELESHRATHPKGNRDHQHSHVHHDAPQPVPPVNAI